MYHVSFVWLTTPSTLYWEKYLKTHARSTPINVLTYVKRGYPLLLTSNNPPLRKGLGLLCTTKRGLGAENGKRAVTDGKGSLNKPLHVEAPPNKTFEKYNPRGFFSEFYSSFNLFPRGCDPSIHCKKLYFLTLLKTVPKTMFKESVLKKKV